MAVTCVCQLKLENEVLSPQREGGRIYRIAKLGNVRCLYSSSAESERTIADPNPIEPSSLEICSIHLIDRAHSLSECQNNRTAPSRQSDGTITDRFRKVPEQPGSVPFLHAVTEV